MLRHRPPYGSRAAGRRDPPPRGAMPVPPPSMPQFHELRIASHWLPAVRPATAPRRRPSGPCHRGSRQVQERGRRQGGMAVVQQAADVPATGSHHAPKPPATLLSPSSTKLDLDQGVEGLGRAHTAGQRWPRRCCPRVRTDFRWHTQAAAWLGGRGGGDGGVRRRDPPEPPEQATRGPQ
jgi:hypothetical protein